MSNAGGGGPRIATEGGPGMAYFMNNRILALPVTEGNRIKGKVALRTGARPRLPSKIIFP